MRTGKYFVVCLSIVFLLAGVYVISIKLHLVMKALDRHMKGR